MEKIRKIHGGMKTWRKETKRTKVVPRATAGFAWHLKIVKTIANPSLIIGKGQH